EHAGLACLIGKDEDEHGARAVGVLGQAGVIDAWLRRSGSSRPATPLWNEQAGRLRQRIREETEPIRYRIETQGLLSRGAPVMPLILPARRRKTSGPADPWAWTCRDPVPREAPRPGPPIAGRSRAGRSGRRDGPSR